MPKTVSTALRHGVLDRRVQNIDALQLKDTNGTVIAEVTGLSWEDAGATNTGASSVTGSPSLTGNSNAGSGTDATEGRLYDNAGSSGEEISGLVVAQGVNPPAWSSGTTYSQGDLVSNTLSGVTFYFEADQNHTAASDNEPGAGETWPAYWTLVDILLENTNIADGQTVDINALTIVEPALLQ